MYTANDLGYHNLLAEVSQRSENGEFHDTIDRYEKSWVGKNQVIAENQQTRAAVELGRIHKLQLTMDVSPRFLEPWCMDPKKYSLETWYNENIQCGTDAIDRDCRKAIDEVVQRICSSGGLLFNFNRIVKVCICLQ